MGLFIFLLLIITIGAAYNILSWSTVTYFFVKWFLPFFMPTVSLAVFSFPAAIAITMFFFLMKGDYNLSPILPKDDKPADWLSTILMYTPAWIMLGIGFIVHLIIG